MLVSLEFRLESFLSAYSFSCDYVLQRAAL
jgi:hypothetical protein